MHEAGVVVWLFVMLLIHADTSSPHCRNPRQVRVVHPLVTSLRFVLQTLEVLTQFQRRGAGREPGRWIRPPGPGLATRHPLPLVLGTEIRLLLGAPGEIRIRRQDVGIVGARYLVFRKPRLAVSVRASVAIQVVSSSTPCARPSAAFCSTSSVTSWPVAAVTSPCSGTGCRSSSCGTPSRSRAATCPAGPHAARSRMFWMSSGAYGKVHLALRRVDVARHAARVEALAVAAVDHHRRRSGGSWSSTASCSHWSWSDSAGRCARPRPPTGS